MNGINGNGDIEIKNTLKGDIINLIALLEGKKPCKKYMHINGGNYIHTYLLDQTEIEVEYPERIVGVDIFAKITYKKNPSSSSESIIVDLNDRDLLGENGEVLIKGEILTQLKKEVIYLTNSNSTELHLAGTNDAIRDTIATASLDFNKTMR